MCSLWSMATTGALECLIKSSFLCGWCAEEEEEEEANILRTRQRWNRQKWWFGWCYLDYSCFWQWRLVILFMFCLMRAALQMEFFICFASGVFWFVGGSLCMLLNTLHVLYRGGYLSLMEKDVRKVGLSCNSSACH